MKEKDNDQIAWDAFENPDMLLVDADLENPQALLFAFQEAFPDLRIYEEKDLKIDGRGMKSLLGDIEV